MTRKDFFGQVNEAHRCSICLKILYNPLHCPNEHYFCRYCIIKWLEGNATCPECVCYLTVDTLQQPPRKVKDMLERLLIHCDYFSRGCQEVVEIQHLDRHKNECGYSPTPCSNVGCDKVFNRNELDEHVNSHCEFRVVTCPVCNERVADNQHPPYFSLIAKEI